MAADDFTNAAGALSSFVRDRRFAVVSGLGDAHNGTRIAAAQGGVLAELDFHISTWPAHFLGSWTENGYGACAGCPWYASDHYPVFSAYLMHLPTEEGEKRRAPPRRHVNYSNMTAELRETVVQCYESELRSLIGRLEGADSPRAAVEAECGVSGLLALVIATIHRCEDRHLGAKTSRPSSGPRRFTESPWVVNSPEVHGATPS